MLSSVSISNTVLSGMLLSLLLLTSTVRADPLVEQWTQGLGGARLSAYEGSVISNNSTLTQLNFCRNGRYSYYREGSWSAPGAAGGASSNRIQGHWEIRRQGNNIFLMVVTDQGQRGQYPLHLQNDGRVNIGGTAFSVQTGAASC